MIGLNAITLRNFISWGDYDTKVSLANRGQCFIAGEIEAFSWFIAFIDTLPRANEVPIRSSGTRVRAIALNSLSASSIAFT